jgi:hypothetical protein
MTVAARMQNANTKAAATVKDITTKAITASITQVAAKVKSIATKAATRNITTSTAAGIDMVGAAAGVVSDFSATANYAW